MILISAPPLGALGPWFSPSGSACLSTRGAMPASYGCRGVQGERERELVAHSWPSEPQGPCVLTPALPTGGLLHSSAGGRGGPEAGV